MDSAKDLEEKGEEMSYSRIFFNLEIFSKKSQETIPNLNQEDFLNPKQNPMDFLFLFSSLSNVSRHHSYFHSVYFS